MTAMHETELGYLYAKVFWEHDAKKYLKLEKAYEKICIILGHKKEAKQIAKHVRNAYYFSDLAEIGEKTYEDCHQEFLKARGFLGLDPKISQYQKKWWVYFRNKNYLSAYYYVLLQHIIMFKGLNLNTIKATYYYYLAGMAHNKRDFDKTAKWLSKYWGSLTSQFKDPNEIPIPI